LASDATGSEIESPRVEIVRDESQRVDTGGGAISDADLERAIVAAVTGGAFDVARVLSSRLEERKRGGVIYLARERERRR